MEVVMEIYIKFLSIVEKNKLTNIKYLLKNE